MLEFTPLFDVEFRACSIVQDTIAYKAHCENRKSDEELTNSRKISLFHTVLSSSSIPQDTRAFDTSFTRFISNLPQSIPRLWKQLLDKIGDRTEAARFVVSPYKGN